MNKKAKIFNDLLENGPEGVFNVEEIGDELHSVIYHSKLNIDGNEKYFMVVFDDTDTTVISVMLDEESVTSDNFNYVVELCNRLNGSNRLIRYYIDEEDRLIMECCVLAREEHFDAELLAHLIDTMAEAASEVLPKVYKAARCEI